MKMVCLFLLLATIGCGIIPYALTDDEAMYAYHRVDASNHFASKRLQALRKYYWHSAMSVFLSDNEAPDCFYEYRRDGGRKGIRLYYAAIGRVYVFEEVKRDDLNPALVAKRPFTNEEKDAIEMLATQPRLLRPADTVLNLAGVLAVTEAGDQMAATATRSSLSRQRDSAFRLDNIAVSASYRWRTVNAGALNNWFVPEGYSPVRQGRLGDFSITGLLSGVGLFELQFSGAAHPSTSLSTFCFGLGFYPELAAGRRYGLYAGAGVGWTIHQDFGITHRVPPSLQTHLTGIPPDDYRYLKLRQEGLSVQPEVRGLYHLGRKADNNFSLFAGTGFGVDILSRWRLGVDDIVGIQLLARPPMPSVSKVWLFGRVGLLFKFRLPE